MKPRFPSPFLPIRSPRYSHLIPQRSLQPHYFHFRPFSSSSSSSNAQSSQSNPNLSPTIPPSRWLSHTRSRIGKCIMFGLSQAQAAQAAEICRIVGTEWRELVAGREGFLTCGKRAGLRRQKVVWGEMDSMGHVNNVTYVRYAESARINWAYNYALHVDPTHKDQWCELWTPKGDGLILRSIKVDYKFPMTFPDHITVLHKLSSPPAPHTSSFDLDVLILSELHQRPAARCEEDIVVYDYKAGKKVELRPWMRTAFERTWVEQEEEKRRVERRIREVEGLVRALERGSWDKEGAVEDVGAGRK